MKITDVKCHLVFAPRRKAFGRTVVTGLGPAALSESVLIEVFTDDGIVGLGEASSVFDDRGAVSAAAIEQHLAPLLVGVDPLRIAYLNRRMSMVLPQVDAARAAIDIALHDIAGKALDVPVYQLLGGLSRERIPLSYSIPYGSAEEAAAFARECVKVGYRTVKIKIGLSPERDVEAMRQVRAAVGPDVIVRVDANMALADVEAAVKLCEAIEPYDPELLEQPLPPEQLAHIARIRARSRVPIMLDESIRSPDETLRAIRAQAGDIANIYVMESGGIEAAMTNFHLCATAGMKCMIGSMPELGVGTAAQIHLGCAVPVLDIASDCCGTEYQEQHFLRKPLNIDGGFAYPPTEPGLGVELDRACVDLHKTPPPTTGE